MREKERFKLKPEYPEEYKGYKVKDLMKTLEEIATLPGGTKADEKQIDVMNDFLEEYKYGNYADEIQTL